MDVPTTTPRTQAILLLCGHFGKKEDQKTKPLSLKEYNALAAWLHGEGMSPEDLLSPEGEMAAAASGAVKEASVRLPALLARGMALAFASDEWAREGIWVIGRGDEDYPRILRARLGRQAPVMLYGVGDVALLSMLAVGAVGSRDADTETLAFSRTLGARVAEAGWAIASGGARGVDQEAMFAAMDSGGSAVGILAEGVSKPSRSRLFRGPITSGALTLISTLVPNARWRVGHAMGRNKYIYALSRATVVASSGTEGGTWTGALENLKHGWAPMWVRTAENVPPGNTALIAKGGLPLSADDLAASDLLSRLTEANAPCNNESVETSQPQEDSSKVNRGTMKGELTLFDDTRDEAPQIAEPAPEPRREKIGGLESVPFEPESTDAFNAVWSLMEYVLREPQTEEQVAEKLGLVRTQARTWLKRAVEENLVVKRSRPVRYQVSQARVHRLPTQN